MTAADESPALAALRTASARLEGADGADDPADLADPARHAGAEADAFEAVHAALVAVLADVDGT